MEGTSDDRHVLVKAITISYVPRPSSRHVARLSPMLDCHFNPQVYLAGGVKSKRTSVRRHRRHSEPQRCRLGDSLRATPAGDSELFSILQDLYVRTMPQVKVKTLCVTVYTQSRRAYKTALQRVSPSSHRIFFSNQNTPRITTLLSSHSVSHVHRHHP